MLTHANSRFTKREIKALQESEENHNVCAIFHSLSLGYIYTFVYV